VLGCVIPLGITSMRFLIMKTSRKGLFIVEEDLVNFLFAFDMLLFVFILKRRK